MFSIIICLPVLVYHSEAGITLGSEMAVKDVKSLVCRSDINLARFPGQIDIYHQWNQVYAGEMNYFIISIPSIKAIHTKFTITLEKFDNNTNIYNSFSAYTATNNYDKILSLSIGCSGDEKMKIALFNNEYYEYHIDDIVTYADSKLVTFSCLQYSHITSKYTQIGWINTLENKIITYNQSEIIMKLTEAHNGSMLCCLYYLIYTEENSKRIERFVENKTLLIYREEWANAARQNSDSGAGTSTEIYCDNSNSNIPDTTNATRGISDTSNARGKKSDTTNAIGKNSDTVNATGKKSGTTNVRDKNLDAPNAIGKKSHTTKATGKNSRTLNATDKISGTTNAKGKNSDATNITDTSDHVSDADNYVIVIISSISAMVLVLLIVMITIIKKRCWMNPNSPDRPQLPRPQLPINDPTGNNPFYLNLLLRRECEQEMEAEEQNYYEEIVYY